MSQRVQILGSRAKGNSGRSMNPCLPASGVWKARGCTIRWGFSPSASSPAFISFRHSRETKGSKWQLMPMTCAPALAILTAHSAADTPCMSPSGPMHMEAATWGEGEEEEEKEGKEEGEGEIKGKK